MYVRSAKVATPPTTEEDAVSVSYFCFYFLSFFSLQFPFRLSLLTCAMSISPHVAMEYENRLASSGDSGCHGRTHEECLLNAKMHPAFPAASPFITAVGGTQFDLKNDPPSTANSSTPICTGSGDLSGKCAIKGGHEIVSSTATHSRITSGGGFSNVAARPAYQDAVVKAYLPQINLNPRIYNAAGRG